MGLKAWRTTRRHGGAQWARRTARKIDMEVAEALAIADLSDEQVAQERIASRAELTPQERARAHTWRQRL